MCIFLYLYSKTHFINGNMFSEYLFTNIFIFKPCLMFSAYERLRSLVAFYSEENH